ncbi:MULTISPECIES: hypothetical protein [Gammaproteobacteria]|uniref:hypothetical protein n=1 Tax=Gammaproteobacteria TaxID=1236 RepID=UPI003A9224B2
MEPVLFVRLNIRRKLETLGFSYGIDTALNVAEREYRTCGLSKTSLYRYVEERAITAASQQEPHVLKKRRAS